MDRREYLALLGGLTVGSTAGCADSDGGDGPASSTRPTTTSTPTPVVEPTVEDPPAAHGPSAPGTESFDELIPQLMAEWDVPGGAVAVLEDGRLVVARGYGLADVERGRPVAPDDRFRIASVSKPITAATVLELVERGELDLDARAFDLLSHLRPSAGVADARVDEITVRMLLQHTAGWDAAERGSDPMFSPAAIAVQEGVEPPASAETIVRHVLGEDLQFDPGTEYAYSNFGYAVLGRIVEAVTGREYGAAVADNLLEPADATGLELGATRLEDRLDDEVRYYGNGLADSVFPGEDEVPRQYGGFSLECMDAHGGWVGSPVDLLRFLNRVDDRRPVADVLDEDTLETMTARPDVARWRDTEYYYANGWNVRPGPGNWWHNGSLPGTTSILVRAGDADLAWAAVFNSRPPNWDRFDRELDLTLWRAVEGVTSWPDHDLFPQFA